jgi:hypothetical protein
LSALNVTLATNADLTDWESFFATRPEAGPLHHPAWRRILSDSFAIESLDLIARGADRRIVGVLPMYGSASYITGRHLASLAPALAASPEAARGLHAEALALRDRRRARYLLLRAGSSLEPAGAVESRIVHTIVPVDRTPEEALAALNAKTRWGVRQAEKSSVEIERVGPGGVEAFYPAYARNMRDLGTPVMAAGYMVAMAERLADRMEVLLARLRGRVIGGMIVVKSGSLWSDLYASIVRECRPIHANYLLYWRAIEAACLAEGVERFDLGRSAIDSGAHAFKRKWRGVDEYYFDRYYFAPGQAPRAATAEMRERRSWKQTVWTRLPLPLANALGPILRRRLPFG